MNKILNTTILVISGILTCLFVGNLLVHLPFYLVDGSLAKLLSPIWMSLNGVMIFLCLVFVFTLTSGRVVSH